MVELEAVRCMFHVQNGSYTALFLLLVFQGISADLRTLRAYLIVALGL